MMNIPAFVKKLLADSTVLALLAASTVLALLSGEANAQSFSLYGNVGQGNPSGPGISAPVDPAAGFYFGAGRVGYSKHIEAGVPLSGGVPVLTSCGTTPTLAANSTDSAGTVTMGTSATGCTITFGTAFVSAPTCTVTWRATPLASQSYTVSSTALTLTQTSASNNLIDYQCTAKSGG